MKYTLNLDENKYILSVGHTQNDNVEIDLSLLDFNYLTAYRFINSEIILDEQKKLELVNAEKQRENEQLKNQLIKKLEESNDTVLEMLEDLGSLTSPTTFIIDLIALGKKYASIIAERKNIRAQIKELE